MIIFTINQLVVPSTKCQKTVKMLLSITQSLMWRFQIASFVQITIQNKGFSFNILNNAEK